MSCTEWIALGLSFASVLIALGIPLLVEYSRRPALAIRRADDLNLPTHNPPARLVHLAVVNRPLTGWRARWLLRHVAAGCKVDITFRSRSDGSETAIPGRWSAEPEPFTFFGTAAGLGVTFDPTKVPASLVHDVSPGEAGEVIGIAIKRDGDASAYAFSSQSYRDIATLRIPEYRLPDAVYDVFVVARTGGMKIEGRFVLRNEGTSYTGLSLESV